MTETEDSITRLFAAEGIRILRQERAFIQSRGEMLNLIGIDYQSLRFSIDHAGHEVEQYLEGSEKLVMPSIVNVLLSHNPNVFDRAAEMGIDLTLAGHAHGGQLSILRGLSLVRLGLPTSADGTKNPAGRCTSTAASELPRLPSASGLDRKSPYWNCPEADLR